jgi:hypothetical protein
MKRRSEASDPEGLRVCLRVGGWLDSGWSSWFEGLTVSVLDNGETRLHGVLADQAALHGLLSRIRDLGVPLFGLEVTDEPAASASVQASPREPDVSERRIEPRSGHRPT